MEKMILTGIFLLFAVLFAWGGVALYRRAQKRGERAGCACLLCFLAAFVCSVFVFKQFPLETAGAVFALAGGVSFYREYCFFKRAIIVRGVVTSYETRRTDKGDNLYAPVVQFEFDGQVRQATGRVYSSGKPKMGKVMKVGVDPQNIREARVFQKSGLILTAVAAVLGIAFLIQALYSHIAVARM